MSDTDRHRRPSVPRLKQRYDDEIRAQLKETLGLGNIMQVPAPREDRHQHGRRPGHSAAVAARGRRRATSTHHHRPEAARHQGQEVDRRLQAPRGQRHRRQGHAAGRPHVGVLRPAHQPGHPPHPRLPRPAAQQLRRPRQLHVRRHRAADLPGDRLRQGRHAPGAWTSPSSPPPAPTPKARPCSTPSASRSEREGQ